MSKIYYYLSLLSLPVLSWIWYYLNFKRLKAIYTKKEMFWRKHNCVVFYSKIRGMSGWPEYENSLKLEYRTYNKFFEPLIYFIETAENSLDIAIMNILIKECTSAILVALENRIKVRIILDYDAMKQNPDMKVLQQNGAVVLYHVSETEGTNSILHYKYVIKDYNEINSKVNGFITFGSMNWTVKGITENYEDLVFTTNENVVETFHTNFEETWTFLQNEKENNLIVKSTLYELL